MGTLGTWDAWTVAGEKQLYLDFIRRVYGEALVQSEKSSEDAFDYEQLWKNWFFPQAYARHANCPYNRAFPKDAHIFFLASQSIHFALFDTIKAMKDRYGPIASHLPAVLIVAEFMKWNLETFATLDVKSTVKQIIDERLKLIKQLYQSQDLIQMQGFNDVLKGLKRVSEELDVVKKSWPAYEAQVGMTAELKSLEHTSAKHLSTLISLLFFVLRPGKSLDAFDPRRAEILLSSEMARDKVLLGLLSDPDVKACVGGDVSHENCLPLPRLDTQKGLEEFFDGNADINRCNQDGFMMSEISPSEMVGLYYKLCTLAAAIGRASHMAKCAAEISAVGGDLLLAQGASKTQLLACLEFITECVNTLKSHLDDLMPRVFSAFGQARIDANYKSSHKTWLNTTHAEDLNSQLEASSNEMKSIIENVVSKIIGLSEVSLRQQMERQTRDFVECLSSSRRRFCGLVGSQSQNRDWQRLLRAKTEELEPAVAVLEPTASASQPTSAAGPVITAAFQAVESPEHQERIAPDSDASLAIPYRGNCCSFFMASTYCILNTKSSKNNAKSELHRTVMSAPRLR